MMIRKLNEYTGNFSEPFECDCCTICDDNSRLVECPSCHEKIPYGQTYKCGQYYTENKRWIIPICKNCAIEFWDNEENRCTVKNDD